MTDPTTIDADIAIIGAGTAGLNARREARRHGRDAILIDPGPYGTTCARVGCMPSKLLIAAADRAHEVRGAGVFGLTASLDTIDGSAVMGRVRRERNRFAGFVANALVEDRDAGELLPHRARFSGPDTLTLDDGRTVRFNACVIATGSSPFVPPPYRELADRLVTTDEIFDWESLPASALVIGAGAIGLELGQALHRLGVDVATIGIGGLVGPLTDPAVRERARAALAAEYPLMPSFDLEETRAIEGGLYIRGTDASGASLDRRFDVAIVAAGRSPNLTSLDLSAAGVATDERGRPTELDADTLQLGDRPLFVAGDANNLHPLLHEAADDGRFAAANACAYPEVQRPDRRTRLGVVFSDPQIATVGHSYESVCDHAAVGEASYDDQGRARVMAVTGGLLRVYAHRETGRLLGAEMCGPSMEHLAHLLAWAVQAELTVCDALRMPFYHPVLEEGVRTALRDLDRALGRQRDAGHPDVPFCAGG